MTALQTETARAICPQCGVRDHAAALDHAAVERAAESLAALGDPTRLGIVTLLASHDRLCVCDIAAAFPVGQPTVSHHLRVLREAGLVDVIRHGQWAYYGLRRDALKGVVSGLVALL
ncbi:MAG: metalloregulator ArsR/SmtB family transcription factor [Armatimonadota bacterium]|nr:metalloregulator ArsR/SmtB family transcription factor [Armatimonadota bacterium]MDR7422016.1 metalloregulator ArsR/SmtB family transcription factor [Armatimonadota bacterium]MDR7454153.1 metalloregulator ArsR/SmtB family transcription factor [Armatimonadota bacterium]MDR7455716.1 metalloregulator ArsR/SmtB family transcription factor [Armatimonadota bacterium]MDR7496961.1 metalloregulator ArsR/SmtB family transcription factor [Armatimonadota bacterium]